MHCHWAIEFNSIIITKTIVMYKYIIIAYFITLSSFSQTIVTSLSDDGSEGTLRHAILNTASGGTIVFDSTNNGGTLTLTSDLPSITGNLTIVGNGISNLTISGAGLYNMFQIAGGYQLTISGITFSNNKSANGSIFSASNNNTSIIANAIRVTGNSNTYAIYSNNSSTITITNSTFNNNSGILFGSDYGSAPSTTSDIETDYTNRITVTGSTFSFNSGIIFNTERYVKIDNCVFNDNSGQIGNFRGLNRYQVLNSTFINNTAVTLFTFWSNLREGWGVETLGTNHHLFDGNTFTGNTGIIINTGTTNEQSKTTITNNSFAGNGTNWTGSPAVVLDNIIFPKIIGPGGSTGSTSSRYLSENKTQVFQFYSDAEVTWSLGNSNDEALFSIDSDGILSFNSPPDFETPLSSLDSNVYVVEVIATLALNVFTKQTLTITVTDVAPAVWSGFNAVSKTYFDGSYEIKPPTSSNLNPIVYSSSNPLVATVSGTTVTITGIGTTTITAFQGFDAVYDDTVGSYTLSISGVNVVNKNGVVSDTDFSYVDKNGKIGGTASVNKNGELKTVKGL